MSTTVLPPAAFGVSGNTTTQVLARIGSFAIDDTVGVSETPDVGLIYAGVNDPPSGIAQATTQLNTEAMILAMKFGAYGEKLTSGGATVADQTALPNTGRPGMRYVVLSDTSTTGGAARLDPASATTITGTVAGSGPAVWEFRRRRAAESGWGRIGTAATAPTHCQRIVVISTNYKNYFVDGSGSTAALSPGRRDTTGTPEPYYATVRVATAAAVAAQNVTIGGKDSVVHADLYGYQRTMIVGGTFPSGGSPTLSETFAAGYVPDFSGGAAYDATKSWSYIDSNQHHNLFGHEIVARVALLSIVNSGWATDLADQGTLVNIKAIGDSQTDYNSGYVRASKTWAPTLGKRLADYLVTL